MEQLSTLEPGLVELSIADSSQILNWGFLILLICFFISVFIIGKQSHLVFSMLNGLFRRKERQSIFYLQNTYGFSGKFLMMVQFILLFGLIVYGFRKYVEPSFVSDVSNLFATVGAAILLFLSFLLYKWMTNKLIGFSFFSKEQNQIRNTNYVSILCLSGLVLLIPVLVFLFFDSLSSLCFYGILFYFISVFLFAVWMTYRIFFHKKVPLLYFILYLCAQEIAPLYILYKGFVYFL